MPAMPSLAQLGAAHEPLLLLDAASENIQVGYFSRKGFVWTNLEAEAGIGLFRCIEGLSVDLGAVRAFAYCEGPGSVLGIRTAAMAIRTWCALSPRPVFAYSGLELVAGAYDVPGSAAIADARRGFWHHCVPRGPVTRAPEAALTGNLRMPEGFRHWSPLPKGVTIVPYVLPYLFAQLPEADLFREVAAPDAFLHEEPQYATWAAQLHRAP